MQQNFTNFGLLSIAW